MDTDKVAQTSATSRKPSGATPALQPPLASLLSRLCGKPPTNLSNPGFGASRVPFAAGKTRNSERGQEREQPCSHEPTILPNSRTRLSALLRANEAHPRNPQRTGTQGRVEALRHRGRDGCDVLRRATADLRPGCVRRVAAGRWRTGHAGAALRCLAPPRVCG